MVIPYYFAYLWKIAWPQVNQREAKETAICVKLSYLFSNVVLAEHECAKCESWCMAEKVACGVHSSSGLE